MSIKCTAEERKTASKANENYKAIDQWLRQVTVTRIEGLIIYVKQTTSEVVAVLWLIN